MAEVVSIRPDPAGEAYRAEVHELCWLARIPDRAEVYIRRHTTTEDVLADCVVVVFGKRLPQDAARHLPRSAVRPAPPADRFPSIPSRTACAAGWPSILRRTA